KWQEIKPIGLIRNQLQFILDTRKQATIQADKFNEQIYKNVTYNLLLADKQFIFEDANLGEQILSYQTKIREILTNAVNLLKDNQLKKEILLSNEADNHSNYQKEEIFKIELYITSLADLGIAFFNDDFLYQSAQVFQLIRELSFDYSINIEKIKKFQERAEQFNLQKIEDQITHELDHVIVRQIISLFCYWSPKNLLLRIQTEENRRLRRIYLKVLERYGKDIYELLIAELSTVARSLHWYYTRNLVALLGRISTDNQVLHDEVVLLLDSYWQERTPRQLVYQIISTLGFIGTASACELLVDRLHRFDSEEDQRADYCQKILSVLLDIESERAIEVVIEYYQRNRRLKELTDKFRKIHISDRIIQSIIAKIQKETQRCRYSFSLLGDTETARVLLRLVAHMDNEQVRNLCQEIVQNLPKRHPLVLEAERTLNHITTPPTAESCQDKALNKLVSSANIAKLICYIAEIGISGNLIVSTYDSIEGQLCFDRGKAIRAQACAYDLDPENAFWIEGEKAFHWCFLLDPVDIENLQWNTVSNQKPITQITRTTELLLAEGLVKRGEILQISNSYISPALRFSQRSVNSFYTNFELITDEPKKYYAVWDALVEEQDIVSLQRNTRLSKYELYKILFYLKKNNLLIVEAEQAQLHRLNLEEGLAMLELNLRRIERSLVMFNYYKISAELCSDLVCESDDEILIYVFDVMHRFYLEHFHRRLVFTETDIEICLQVLSLVTSFLKHHNAQADEILLNYVKSCFSAQYTDAEIEDSAMGEFSLPVTVLEKIENIDLINDPLDPIVSLTDKVTIDEIMQAIEIILNADSQDSIDNDARYNRTANQIKDMFDSVAVICIKPLKDFIRELYRNWKTGCPTSLKWADLIEPVFTLLSATAIKFSYLLTAELIDEMHTIVAKQQELAELDNRMTFDEDSIQRISINYVKLCELQPRTFALVLSEQDLSGRKELLLIRLIFKQVTETNEKIFNKLLISGLNNLESFLQTEPEEFAARADIPKQLAEKISLKFFQYGNLYYHSNEPEQQRKFIAMFEVNLRMLKEIHREVELFAIEEQAGSQEAKERKDSLRLERQQMLWALFVLLCIREEFDLIELIQQSVYNVRIRLLEDYLTRQATQATSQSDSYL
ncbi:MAG: hypothetical protein AB1489_35565, partial [Acidobacteriota bacterium]